MENVKIDNSCVYVPIQYEGKVIVIVKKGGDSNNGMQIKKPVRYDENTAWGDHQGKAKCDIEYDIYQWNPRELIGTAKCCGDNYSSSNYSSSSTSTSDNISWWEFGHSDEFFLKSLFLLPFRLIAYAIMIPLSIGFWAISFVYKIIASIFIIFVSIIILMPIKIILFIISFGYWDGFKERFIKRLEYIWN